MLSLLTYDLDLKDVTKWGFALTNIGGGNILVLASSLPYLFEYNWPAVESAPVMQNQYETQYDNPAGLLPVQVNLNFISVQVGKLVTVYQRSMQSTTTEYIFTSLVGYDFVQMLAATDNLLVYNSSAGVVSNYRLWRRPTLQVGTHQWQSIHITATS